MVSLDLLIPGLFGPFSSDMPDYIKQQLNHDDFKLIKKCLMRADCDQVSATDYYQTLLYLLNPQCELSVCQLTAKYDHIDTSQGFFYRADPVHFRAESDHAILLGTQLVAPSLQETEQLIYAFNQHFKDDKIQLYATKTNHWYLRCERELNLEFNSLDYSLGRDIKHFMPEGDDELWWRKIVNEAQMLFFQHDVNHRREQNGQLSINGLWLWDLKPAVENKNHVRINTLFSDELLSLALADYSDVAVKSKSSMKSLQSSAVLVLDQLYEPVCYGDADEWIKELKQFSNDSFQFVIDLLMSKKIDEVNIYPCDGRVYKINRLKLLRFWKQNKVFN